MGLYLRLVPQVDWFAAGFECDNFSTLNNDSELTGCLAAGGLRLPSVSGRFGAPEPQKTPACRIRLLAYRFLCVAVSGPQ